MLELKHISKTFFPGTVNAKTALDDLSLTLHDGDFITVIGGNGAGKSTMLNAVAGTLTVDSGSILLDGEDITHKPEHRRAADLGRVFQDPMMGTAGDMWIEENLALAARRGSRRTFKWGISRAEREEYRALLAPLGLGLEKLPAGSRCRRRSPLSEDGLSLCSLWRPAVDYHYLHQGILRYVRAVWNQNAGFLDVCRRGIPCADFQLYNI